MNFSPALTDSTLEQCEKTIEEGLTTFVEVGRALMQIRDARLYREKYRTFEEYCHERWGMSKNYSNRLISASLVIPNLVPIGTVPCTESQTRPLTQLSPKDQLKVWEKAVKQAESEGRVVTAKDVSQVVEEMKPQVVTTPKKTKFKHTETHLVSDALAFATMAITNLERIQDDDPKWEEALNEVQKWIENYREKRRMV